MYEWEEQTEYQRIEQYRKDYRRYGLAIFESFEEYAQDREEEREH